MLGQQHRQTLTYSQVIAERDAGRRIIAEQSDLIRRLTELNDRLAAAGGSDTLHAEPDMDRCG
ncbi:hypothetical protein SEA_PAOLA_43 [Mycobacterium phage Paola]|uniref:Uncharacterized protein n=1 Tax=Mycobacterium phage Paola TaxID=2094139 RepID=A0A2P1JZR4_9CAUD|nr:hypothetical protein PBI_OKIROE_43 [Mycobacterium phage OkiRoe]YP_009950849.1 hypothetical protein I5G74_gp54 [Mycobacterium phage Paola]AHZ95604.1 hypothetical protein PBI_OKIROE_43 [Mycobacterium phage OkiRoe]ASR85831.1 hypothetical protein SEA_GUILLSMINGER_44 [Mycobacterium phage Guillsminger]AVO25833.1 hypothetical protein SEA_PAOLA_43 [Mycobacterium phage Paola]